MPVLKKIVIQNFRNIELQELDFSSNVNCITGGNGEGKTNLLDAIWYLSMTKSAFGSNDQFNIRFGCENLAISGSFDMGNGLSSRFSISSGNSGKVLRKDDKNIDRISSHIGTLPIVMVSPADIAMVSESGEERRRFANSVLSQMSAAYLSDIQQYNRILLQRNKFLKSGSTDEDLFLTFDAKLSDLAEPIFRARKKLCEDLIPRASEFYKAISGGKEEIGIEYKSDLSGAGLKDILLAQRERDRILKYTGVGIQRDDFIFTMNGHPIRKCGSQGQQKSFLVALKFAEYEVMKDNYGFPPILLLDDLFDKLDMQRVSNLLTMVAGNDFGQIFLSDSNKVRVRGIVDVITTDRKYFEAEKGTFKVL